MASPLLPVRLIAAEICAAIERHPRVILTAETGSGKTTQVPQILLESHAIDGEILVLEPRRLAARLVAQRVAEEIGQRSGRTALGGIVGFQTRFERSWSDQTRIGFVTEGIFLRRMERDPLLRGVGAVVLDEFHERSVLADLSLGLVERLQTRDRTDLKMVVMSATLDAERLSARLAAPVLHAEGRHFPVEIVQRPAEANWAPWDQAAHAIIEELDAGRLDGDVLVFMPGAAEIEHSVEAISAALRARGDRAAVLGLHGGMRPQAQDEALRPRAERRVIVATNVAQTSITIDGIRTVIDAGTARVARHDPRRALDALVLEPISRAAADQRAGRAGRTAPGRCVRLWSEQDHARRPAFDAPEVLRSDLADPMLTLAAALPAGFADAARFAWVDAPPPDAIEHARALLLQIGCIDADGTVTAIGRKVAALPLHPRLGRAMVEAERLGCVERTAAWCAIASGRELVDERDPGARSALSALLEKGEAPSDMLVRERMLGPIAGGRARANASERSAAARVRGDPAALAETRRTAEQLLRLIGAGTTRSEDLRAVTCAMLTGFPDFVAYRPDRLKPHALVSGRRKVEIDRDTLVRGDGFMLALSARAHPRDPATQLLTMLAPIERTWLEEAVPDRFARVVEQRWSSSTRAVEEIEQWRFDGIAIDSTARPARNLDHAATILAAQIAEGEVELPQWNEQVEQWIARVRCVAEWFPDRALLRYDEDDLAVIRAEIVHGCTRASQLADRPCLDAVRSALSHDDARFVDRMAPADLPLPNGRRLRLRYQPGQPPRGATRIQDLFDLRETPSVAGGRVAVLLEILAPSQRPLQVTSDLKGFFERLYPQLRPELRRRYPKHEWR